MAMPKAPPASTPLTGDEIVRLIQSGKLVLAKASDLRGPPGASAYEIAKALGYAGTQAQWLASLKGADGSPTRFETYTATSNASGIATFTWPAFTIMPLAWVRPAWNGDQYVGGGVTATTLNGCTALAKRSRGALLLSAGPFETAPSTALTVIVIGR